MKLVKDKDGGIKTINISIVESYFHYEFLICDTKYTGGSGI